MTRAAPRLLLAGILVFLAGCTSLFGRRAETRRLPVEAAVRVHSGKMMGSGALALADPRVGSYVLTAAHLLDRPDRVLVGCNRTGGGMAWHTGRVLRLDPRIDLALIWLPECVLPRPARLAWIRAPLRPGESVTVLVAAPEPGPRAVAARVFAPGGLEASHPLAQGMSGGGVFHNGFLAGVLYGQERPGGPDAESRGRFLPIETVCRFLDPEFRFLSDGGVPAEPR